MELLTIGRFAELTGLTPRALRHYERLGLLEPVLVDETNRYRYYAPAQRWTAAAMGTASFRTASRRRSRSSRASSRSAGQSDPRAS